MTPEERTLLSDLFRHLREVESQPRDAEAEALIRQSVQAQPYAPYYMAQTVLVQQQALTAAQQRIEQLERQLKEAQERPPAQAPASGGSFLSNALGLGRSGWGGRSDDRAPPPPATRGPWGAPAPGYAQPQPGFGQPGFGQPGMGSGGYAQPAYAPQAYAPRGGGFLAGAAQTAAGVAGGMLAASAISSLLSHSPGPFGEAAASTAAAPVGDTVINNFYGDSAGTARDVAYDQGGGGGGGGDQGADYQDAGYQGDDYGGGDDDSWT